MSMMLRHVDARQQQRTTPTNIPIHIGMSLWTVIERLRDFSSGTLSEIHFAGEIQSLAEVCIFVVLQTPMT